MAQRVKRPYVQVGIILVVVLIFGLVAWKYFADTPDRNDVRKLIVDTRRALSYRLKNCPGELLQIDQQDKYLCRSEVEESIYVSIFDNYPIEPDGKEIMYEFLDQGEMSVANDYLRDYHYVERFESVKIEPPLTWEEDPYNERYWRFVYYSLRSTRHLLYAAHETNDPAYAEKLVEILDSFLIDGMDSESAWDDPHSVAFRTMVLVNTWWKLRELNALPVDTSTRILEALEVHADYLLEEEHFEGTNNHGITEASALIVLAASFPDLPGADEWMEVGNDRLNYIMTNIVDEDGVLVENSPYYHFYSLRKFWEIYLYAESHNIHLDDVYTDRLEKMIDYATYVLQPDRYVPLLGASLEYRIWYAGEHREMASVNDNLYYVLTQGEEGTPPRENHMVFPSSGQTIMRSTWTDERYYENQTQVIFDYGPYRTSHSDLDAMNFVIYSNGAQLLVDSGLYTYEEDEYREYFHGTAAHNTVVVDGKNQNPGSGYPGEFESGPGYAIQTAYQYLNSGVVHHRAVALLGRDFVLVIDRLASPEEHEYAQRFHVPPGVKLITDGMTVRARGDKPSQSLTFYQILDEGLELETVIDQQEPLDGVCSYVYEETEPCYALSYIQHADVGTYITLIEIGKHDEELSWDYDDAAGSLQINTTYGDYTFDIDFAGYTTVDDNRGDTYSLELVHTGDDWQLQPAPAATVPADWLDNYSVGVSEDGFLTINRQDNDDAMRFVTDFDGLDIYSSWENQVVTEFPADLSAPAFRFYEQEDYLPIFGYHNILFDDEPILPERAHNDMHRSLFISQLDYATNTLGCHWHTFGDIVENYILAGRKIPDHACVMNFDDGHLNNYTMTYPILTDFGIRASFYLPTARIGSSKGYMTWEQVDEMYANGHEIGGHAVNSSDLTDPSYTREELVHELKDCMGDLRVRGYDVTTFAYPQGLWNDEIIGILKESGFIAGRDTSKDNNWRDRRALSVGWDDYYLWHMYYIKPEHLTQEDFDRIFSPTGWWQIEEEARFYDPDGDTKTMSSAQPTSSSWAVVELPDPGDSVSTLFMVSGEGNYTIGVFGATADLEDESRFENLDNFNVYIDSQYAENQPGSESECVAYEGRYYCEFFVYAHLTEGTHSITVEAGGENVYVDRFRVFRVLEPADSYALNIEEYSNRRTLIREAMDIDVRVKGLGFEASPWWSFVPNTEVGYMLLIIAVLALIWFVAKLRLWLNERWPGVQD